MKRFGCLLVLSFAMALLGCRHQQLPEDVLPADKMVDFLTAAYQLEAVYALETQYRYDRLTESVVTGYDSILEVLHLDRQQVETSLQYYSDHLDAYQAIQDSVVARLNGGL